jgi:hypothetical protein
VCAKGIFVVEGRGVFLNELVKNGGRNTFEVGWLENNKGV